MSGIAPHPWLPIELIENIISEVWSSPLSSDERITLMTSSALVNKTWSNMFFRVSFKDVYIPCPSYFDQYLRILREDSPIFDEHTKSLPDILCRSINLMVEHTPIYPALVSTCDEPPMGKVLSDLAYTLTSIPYLPNLRTISVEYLNTGFDDLFDNFRFISFPEQVTDLELTFTFTPLTPRWLVDALRTNPVRQECIQWALPSIRRLSIKGGSEALIADMVSVCPEMEVLEIDTPVESEHMLPQTHLVTLQKAISNLEGEASNVLPTAKLTISSGSTTFPSGVWEGYRLDSDSDVYQFRRSQ
jgi:hypothetical protein